MSELSSVVAGDIHVAAGLPTLPAVTALVGDVDGVPQHGARGVVGAGLDEDAVAQEPSEVCAACG